MARIYRPNKSVFQGATVSLILLFAVTALLAEAAPADRCSNLETLQLPNTKITSAETIPAGAPLDPLGIPPASFPASSKELPSFCRVTAEIHPVKDSDIKMEVWMPTAGWNGKFMGQGNGGFAGTIHYAELRNSLLKGYATASTDTGHTGGNGDAAWAIGHPEKVIDFGYRAIHEMTIKAKSIVKAYYAKPPQQSYFASCSNGGRQALMEAQRFPEDYNGILAGAPANNWTHAFAGFVWDMQALYANPASRISPAKLPLIHAAVMKACDAQDGVTDGVLTNPSRCHFDPAVLACKDGNSECLTAPQMMALKKVYAGVKDSHGASVYPGFMPGGELGYGGWAPWIDAPVVEHNYQYALGQNFYVDMVYDNPKWDYRSFQVDRDVKAADDKLARILNATDPHLEAFADRGGKLILYQGWSDPAIAPLNTIQYYNSVVATMPAKSASFIRLYMIPGMQHCGGGSGAVQFEMLSGLERWVKSDIAPKSIIAKQYKDPVDLSSPVVMTRPICPYPQEAHYKGFGDTRSAASFECAR